MESSRRNRPSQRSQCPICRAELEPWITTCPTCSTTVHAGESGNPLSSQLAPPMTPVSRWIDIPVSSDEPAKVALLVAFLRQHEVPYDQSKRFVSIPYDSADIMIAGIDRWAIHNDLIDDPRRVSSLVSTLREIGAAVLWAIDDRDGVLSSHFGRSGIDLR